MILCVDIGNTSLKIARAGKRGVGRVHVLPAVSGTRELTRALARAGGGRIEHAVVASVRPSSTAGVCRAIRRELGIAPLVVTHRSKLPLVIATRRPSRVGIDRVCAASGAIETGGRHAIVVDAGTAVTVDLVLDRRLLGGLILAGPQTALSALHRGTAQLPDLRLADAGDRFDDTIPAMQTGALVGTAGAVDAAVRWLKARAGRSVPVWIGGGHAPRLFPLLPSGWRFEAHLTLRGLASIARLNVE